MDMTEKQDAGGLPDESELYSLIQENQKRFRRIVRYMPVMIWVFDDRGKLVFWNCESERITGYTAKEMVGATDGLSKICAENGGSDSGGMKPPGILAPDGETSRGEMDICCRNGNRKTISWSKVRRTFPVPGWHSWMIAVDVTERRKAENTNRALFQISNAVNQTRNLHEFYGSIHKVLKTVMDLPNFYIAIHDRENDRIVFPYNMDEVDGKYPPIRNVSRTASLTGEIIRTGRSLVVNRSQIMGRLEAADREEIGTPAEGWLGVPLKVGGDVIGAMAIQSYKDPEFVDKVDVDLFMAVSEQVATAIERKRKSDELIKAYRSLEARVRERTRALEAANTKLQKENEERLYLQDRLIRSERLAATGQLAASIAHEINSPLQGISSLLAAMKRADYQDEKLLRNISLIDDAFDRIGNTVKNLMDLNRPGKENKQPVNLNRIVENTAALIRNFLKLKRVHIETDLYPGLPSIQASPQQMGQVLMNLINNAVEAINSVPRPEVSLKDRPAYEGIIAIKTDIREDAIVLTVTDDGPGFRVEDIGKLFDPFFTRKKTMGMGVGLSICYGIVEDHKGTIEINPGVQTGAEFIITLPLKPREGAGA